MQRTTSNIAAEIRHLSKSEQVSPPDSPLCRWFSLPSQQDQATMSLSSSACPMMLCVRDSLLSLHQVLSLSLFQLAWQGLAERLDNLLYQDVSNGNSQRLHPSVFSIQLTGADYVLSSCSCATLVVSNHCSYNEKASIYPGVSLPGDPV